MKKLKTLSALLFFTYGLAHAQLIDEQFDSGFPGLWTQASSSSLVWEHNSQLGVTGSGCVLVDYSSSSSSGNAWIQTPFMDLTTIQNAEIVFSTALVLNNFLAPEISLWYDTGSGWNYITNWGSTPNSENTINFSSDLTPPLEASNVDWVTDLSYDISPLGSLSSVRFAFGADFSNGGWVLLDDVMIRDASTGNVGLSEVPFPDEISVYPNPSTDVVHVNHHNIPVQQLELYDVSGRKMLDQPVDGPNKTVLSVDAIKKGTYLLILHCADHSYNRRICIN